ncbi:MAG: hypothetical protein KGQ57_05535 [Burkholderiales bacterium]|nr:hypothetical protein [Burkholderiales bacterium]
MTVARGRLYERCQRCKPRELRERPRSVDCAVCAKAAMRVRKPGRTLRECGPAVHRGVALPSALMLAAMMLTTSAAWLEASNAQTRHAADVHAHMRASQAALSALTLCDDALRAGVAPVMPAPNGPPPHWTTAEAFDRLAAYEPVPSWPGSARPPQCLIEEARFEGNPDAHGYWITARGFGASVAARAVLQLVIRREGGRERRAWRRILADGAGR